MALVHWNDEIQTFAPDGSDDALAESIRGGRSDRSPQRPDAAFLERGIDSGGEDRVAVMDHESIGMVVCEEFTELLNRPFRSRMVGHVDMQNPPRSNLHRDEDVDHPESRSDGNKEIASNNGLRMVVNECRPALIASLTTAMTGAQVFPHSSRRYADSEFNNQFVGDALFSPGWILPREPTNDFAQVRRQRRAATPPRLPSPELPECISMPFEKSFWLDDDQGTAPVEESGQCYHRQPKCRRRSLCPRLSLLKKRKLFTQEQVFGEESRARWKKTPEQNDQLCILRGSG